MYCEWYDGFEAILYVNVYIVSHFVCIVQGIMMLKLYFM